MKKIAVFLLLLCLLCGFTSCTTTAPEDTAPGVTEGKTDPPTETQAIIETQTDRITETESDTERKDGENKEMSYQLIPDLEFKKGISLLSQKDHSKNEKYSVLAKHDFYGGVAADPLWLLAQWDSGPDLVSSLIDSPSDTITDGKWRRFRYDAKENTMEFRLDTSAYYNGKPSVEGDYWPHLLVEQGDFEYYLLKRSERQMYKCSTDKMIVSLDIRLGDYSETPVDGDWVRAAQFLMYFYIKSVENNDFCWFGLQFFDSRAAENEHHIGYDGGKPDASGAMIYLIGSKYVYQNADGNLWKGGKPAPDGDWVHIEMDIKPYIEDMFKRGRAEGYFKTEDISNLRIGGMNIGWETIGTFDHTMYVKDLQLISYKENK